MNIVFYILLALCFISCVIALAKAGLFKRKKKKSKLQEKPKEEVKPQEKPEQKEEADRSFKITKKARLSRISRKALETNSRTATIEKVFERTPPQTEQNGDIYVEQLAQENQELLDKINELEKDNRKVVSLKQLKQEMNSQQKEINKEKQYFFDEDTKSIDAGRAGEIIGDYSGVHLGSSKRQTKSFKQNEQVSDEDIQLETQDELNKFSSMNSSMFRANGFSNHSRRHSAMPSENSEEKDFDFSDAVVAEAILNPKYKKIKNNKK